MTAPVFISQAALARRWSCDEATLRRHAKAGTLRAHRLPGGVRYRLADVERIEREAEQKPEGIRLVKGSR